MLKGKIIQGTMWLLALMITACVSSPDPSTPNFAKPEQLKTEPELACQSMEIWSGVCLDRAADRAAEADFAGAEKVLDELCLSYGYPAACSDAVERMLAPSDVLFNPSRALVYLDRKCQAWRGRLEACQRLAIIYAGGVAQSFRLRFDVPSDWQGLGLQPQPAKAVGSFSRACQLGDREACRKEATEYASGRHVRRDPNRAYTLYRQLCYEGDARSCDDALRLRVLE